MPQYVGPQPKPIHNPAFSILPLRKSNLLSFLPVAAVIIFVADTAGVPPTEIVKR
jgi:hypothetical protein